jgi:predicted phage tail protein
MPRWLQILLHIGTTAVGAYAAYATGTPLPMVVSAGTQAVIGGIAQSYNPDGSSAKVAYDPAAAKAAAKLGE